MRSSLRECVDRSVRWETEVGFVKKEEKKKFGVLETRKTKCFKEEVMSNRAK